MAITKQNTAIYLASNYSFKLLTRLSKETTNKRLSTLNLVGYPQTFGKAWLQMHEWSNNYVTMSKGSYACSIYDRTTSLLNVRKTYTSVDAIRKQLFMFSIHSEPLLKFLSGIRVSSPLRITFGEKSVLIEQMDDNMEAFASQTFLDVPREAPLVHPKSVVWPVLKYSSVFRADDKWFAEKLKGSKTYGNKRAANKKKFAMFARQGAKIKVLFVDQLPKIEEADASFPFQAITPPPKKKGRRIIEKSGRPAALHPFLIAVETEHLKKIIKYVNKQSIVTILLDPNLPVVVSVDLGNAKSRESSFMTAIAPVVHYAW